MGSSSALARRRTPQPQRFAIGEENQYALDVYNPDVPLPARIGNLQSIMETVLQQAKLADESMRTASQDVQDALFSEKDMFDDFMSEFSMIPEVQDKIYSENRSYQNMLDEYMSRFGAHVENVGETLDG